MLMVFFKEYRLDFSRFSKKWDGSVATVVSDSEEHVWGVLWQLSIDDLASLDKQEGVRENDKGVYKAFDANIVTSDGKNVKCRSYMLVKQPNKQVPLPVERRPSKAYIQTIQNGARESNIPLDYVEKLDKILNNGNDGPINLYSLNDENHSVL